MSLEFNFKIDAGNNSYYLKELSFVDYRNFVKTIVDTDEDVLKKSFTTLINNVCVGLKPKNIFELFLTLLKYRVIVIDPNITIDVDDRKGIFELDIIYSTLNSKYNLFEYRIEDTVYYFDFPNSLTPPSSKIDLIFDCLAGINESVITPNDKPYLQDNLPALPVNTIYEGLIKHFKSFTYYIPQLDFTIDPFESYSCLTFLRSIYFYDLKNLYDMEYMLRRNLNYSALDLTTFSLPECNIMLASYNKEVSEANKQSSSNQQVDQTSQQDN